MTGEPTDKARRAARNAAAMLRAKQGYDPHDTRANVVDALTDLLHFADRERLDFDSALATARMHHEAEEEVTP